MTDALSPLLVRAARGEPVERPPVWAMRQAGRWDPEFNKLRQGLSFYEFSENVELAARASLLPRRFGVDAIILFYDITSLPVAMRSEEHTSELQSRSDLVCRLLLEKKKNRDPYWFVSVLDKMLFWSCRDSLSGYQLGVADEYRATAVPNIGAHSRATTPAHRSARQH